MTQTHLSFWKNPLVWNPWLYFGIFSVTNFLLTWGHFDLQSRLRIGALGLIIPFGVGIKTISVSSQKMSVSSPESNQPVPLWVWGVFLSILFASRFCFLNSIPLWPVFDEGSETNVSLHLYQNWEWRLLWLPVPHEPLYDWLLALFFKICPPSFFSTRLFSTLLSLITVFTAYWGARAFFSKRFSFLFSWILAFSYWALTLSRLCIMIALIPLFMGFAWGCLGRLIQSQNHRVKLLAGIGLIIANILGLYSWTNWIGVAATITFYLFFYTYQYRLVSKKYFLTFILINGAAMSPLICSRLSNAGMNHISEIFSFNVFSSLAGNLNGLFWDGSSSFPFGSIWGGFFNPLLVSLSLIGVLFFVKQATAFWIKTILLSVFFCWAPALFSSSIEFYRNLPLMFLITLSSAWGLYVLTRPLKAKWKWSLLLLVLICAEGMDGYNYFFYYCDIHKAPPQHQFRSTTYAHAYQILHDLQKQDGPIYVFSEFNTDYLDKTLNVPCFPFDPNQNKSLFGTNPLWTAVLTNMNYAPYFLETFKNCRFIRLKFPDDPSDKPEHIGLFLIPTASIPEETLKHWKESDKIHRFINFETLKTDPNAYWNSFASELALSKPNLFKDPFLIASYWEKLGFFHFMAKNYSIAAQDYQTAIEKGYPARHLYYDLGLTLKIIGRDDEAKKALAHVL